MRLTWRDAVSTVLLLAALAMGVSVIAGWGWPLLGGVRAGIIAVGVTGFAGCLLASKFEKSYYLDPFGLITTIIAMAMLAIAIVGGLIYGTQEFLLMLMLVTGMLWLLATVRHAVEGVNPAPRIEKTTQPAPGKRAFG